jgi:hypothetical protein
MVAKARHPALPKKYAKHRHNERSEVIFCFLLSLSPIKSLYHFKSHGLFLILPFGTGIGLFIRLNQNAQNFLSGSGYAGSWAENGYCT